MRAGNKDEEDSHSTDVQGQELLDDYGQKR